MLAVAPAGPAFNVNQPNPTDQSDLALGVGGTGRYVAVWTSEGQDGDSYGVYGRVFAADGSPLTGEFLVAQTTEAVQWKAAVAVDADGDFVVAWESHRSGGVMVRQFTAGGVPKGDEFVALSGYAANLSVASNAAGDFVVVGQKTVVVGGSVDVYGQRYTAAGATAGSEFRINVDTAGDQSDAAVAMDAAGGFAVAWTTGAGIYGRRFDAAGAPLGGDFRIDTVAATAHANPAIGMDDAGRFVVAWDAKPGAGNATYVRRYTAAGTPATAAESAVSLAAATERPSLSVNAGGGFAATWVEAGVPMGQLYDGQGAKDGGPFRVYPEATVSGPAPVALADDGSFLVAWTGPDNPRAVQGGGLFARRFTPVGAPATVGDLVWLDGNGNGVRDAADQGVNGVAVYLYRADGVLLDVRTTADGGQYRFDVVRPGDSYYLRFAPTGPNVFTARDAGPDDARDSDADRTGRTAPFAAAPGQVDLTRDAGLAAPATVTGTVFDDADNDGARGPAEGGLPYWIVSVDYDEDGARDPDEPWAVTDATGKFTIAGLSPGGYRLVTGVQTGWALTTPPMTAVAAAGATTSGLLAGARTTVVPPSLAPAGGEAQLNATTAGAQSTPAVAAFPDGSYIAVWTSANQDGSGSGVYGRRFAADNAPLGGEFLVNQTTAGSQAQPAVVAHASGAFTVAWSSDHTGTTEVYLRWFDAAGAPATDERPAEAGRTLAAGGAGPAVGADAAGNVVVAWTTYDTVSTGGPRAGIFARRFDASAAPLSASVRLDGERPPTFDTPAIKAPAIAVGPAGDFTAVWDVNLGGSAYALMGRRFDAAGAPVGDQFAVPASSAGGHSNASVARFADGRFVVAWQATQGDGSGGAVLMRRFKASGVPEGGDLVVNTFANGNQANPAVAVDADGNVVVAWDSPGKDGTVAIGLQRFDAAGRPVGIELQPNTYTARNQRLPALAVTAAGDAVVAWASDGQDGSGDGVFAQRFTRFLDPASVGGFAWNDADGDGRRDATETARDGVIVNLLSEHGMLLGTATTANGGRYRLDGLRGGAPHVVQFVAAGVVGTRQDTGGDDAADSDVSPFTLRTAPFVLPAGAVDLTRGAGLVAPGSVSGTLYVDYDSSNTREPVEPPLAGWTVFADLDRDGQLDPGEPNVKTDAAGRYTVPGLPPGTYAVRAVAQAGWSQVTPAADLDVDLPVGYAYRGLDVAFRSTAPAAAVGGVVWTDADGDGVRDAGEVGRDGVTVRLLTGAGATVATAVTAGGGLYRFEQVTPGAPYVLEIVLPSGTLLARPDRGANDAVDSDFDPATRRTAPVTLAADQADLTRDAGLVTPASVAGTVFNDADSDQFHDAGEIPLPGWEVYLDLDGDGQRGAAEPQATTDQAGAYAFAGLPPGSYRVGVLPQRDWARTTSAQAATAAILPGQARVGVDVGQHTDAPRAPVTPVGGEHTPHAASADRENQVAAAMDAAGNYVLTWYGPGGLHGRRYDANGTPRGPAFVVHAAGVSGPVVAMDADGAFTVLWVDRAGVQGAGPGVYGRRFDAAGLPLGAAFPVHTGVWQDVDALSAGMDAGGTLTVAWHSNGQDGDGLGVYARRYNAAGVALGPEFLVSTATAGDQSYPDVDVNAAGDAVIAWSGPAGAAYVRRYDSSGAALGPEVVANPDSPALAPVAVALGDDGDFAVAWVNAAAASTRRLHARRFAADGAPQGRPFVASSQIGPAAPGLEMDGSGNFTVVYSAGTDGDDAGAFARRFNAAGVPQGEPFRVNTAAAGDQSSSAVAGNAAGAFVVAWTTEYKPYGTGANSDVSAQLYAAVPDPAAAAGVVWDDADGDGVRDPGEPGRDGVTVMLYTPAGALADTTVTAGGGLYRFDALLPGAPYQVRLSLPTGVVYAPFRRGGDPAADSDVDYRTGASPAFAVAAAAGEARLDVGVTPPGSVAGARFNDVNGDGVRQPGEQGLAGFVVFLDADGDGLLGPGEASRVSAADGSYSFTGLTPGVYELRELPQDAWQVTTPAALRTVLVSAGGRVTAANLGGRAAAPTSGVGAVGASSVVGAAGGTMTAGAVAPDGRYVLAWQALEGADSWGIFARRFAADGTPLGAVIHVNTVTVGPQTVPDVAVDAAGNFVVVWEQDQGGGVHVRGQRYTAAGARVGGEFPVTTVPGHWRAPHVTGRGDGSFVVAWYGGDGNQAEFWDEYLQRYDAAGQRVGGATRVNAEAEGIQSGGLLGTDAAGNVLAVWGDGASVVRGQWFAPDGARRGGEVVLHTGSAWYDLAVAPSGDFALVRTSGSAVYLHRYAASGVPQGAAVEVPSAANPGANNRAAVAIDPDGNIVVTYMGVSSGGWGTYVSRFNAAGVPQGAEFLAGPGAGDTSSSTAGGSVVAGWYGFVVAWAGPSARFYRTARGGDANADGRVDFADLVRLAQNYDRADGRAWADGDFNADGIVDFNDLVVLAQNYEATPPAAPVAAAAAPRESFAAAFARATALARPPARTSPPKVVSTKSAKPVPQRPAPARKPDAKPAGKKPVPAPPPVARPASPFAARKIRVPRDAAEVLA
jgi:hypothetical protein